MTDLGEQSIYDWFFIRKIYIIRCVFERTPDPPSKTHCI